MAPGVVMMTDIFSYISAPFNRFSFSGKRKRWRGVAPSTVISPKEFAVALLLASALALLAVAHVVPRKHQPFIGIFFPVNKMPRTERDSPPPFLSRSPRISIPSPLKISAGLADKRSRRRIGGNN
jgi:hypothetical protein